MTPRSRKHKPHPARRRENETRKVVSVVAESKRMHTPLLDFMNLFAEFRGSSWDGWGAILARLTEFVREFYGIIGRGGGKSLIAALIACYYATREYTRSP